MLVASSPGALKEMPIKHLFHQARTMVGRRYQMAGILRTTLKPSGTCQPDYCPGSTEGIELWPESHPLVNQDIQSY